MLRFKSVCIRNAAGIQTFEISKIKLLYWLKFIEQIDYGIAHNFANKIYTIAFYPTSPQIKFAIELPSHILS